MYSIPFNKVTLQGNELAYVTETLVSGHLSGDDLYN